MELDNYISTDKTFSIGTNLNIPQVDKVKKFLKENCENKYDFPAHLGIVMTAINPEKLDAAFNYCENYFKDYKKIPARMSEIKYFKDNSSPENTMIEIDVIEETLQNLHKNLVEYFSKNFKDNFIRSKDFERIQNNTLGDKEKENCFKYGFSYVLDLYKPHITIGSIPTKYLDEKLKEKIANDLKGVEDGFITIDNIHIIYHTHPKIQTESVTIKRLDIKLI